MKLFVAASYSDYVNYDTGEVFPEYQEWLEGNLTQLEKFGHAVFCALRADGYKINDGNPAKAFSLDEAEIKAADGMVAFIAEKPSEGVQTEIGMAIGRGIPVALAHSAAVNLKYFNQAIVLAGQAKEIILPLESDPFPST